MEQRNASWEGQSIANFAAAVGTNAKTVKDDHGLAITEAIEKTLEAAGTATTAKA
jgi:hypothetical protein